MKLSLATDMSVAESDLICDSVPILENDEGPRWRFNYSNFGSDPNPDILLLGAYRHPRTLNDLVGGVNLHYLNKQQLDNLSRALPQIMGARNLRERYNVGRRLLPDIFDNYYRTYNSDHIRGVEQDVLYPKYGFVKTAANWLKKKFTNTFRSKERRAQEAQPKYPEDIESMRRGLNRVVQQLQQERPEERPEAALEIQAAKREAEKQRVRQTPQEIKALEDYPMQQAQEVIEPVEERPNTIEPVAVNSVEPEREPVEPQPQRLVQSIDRQSDQQQIMQPQAAQQQAAQPNVEQDTQEVGIQQQLDPEAELEFERQQNRQELLDPENNINLEESIVYYSPIHGRYVVEKYVIDEEYCGVYE